MSMFQITDPVVYPSHGVGVITGEEMQTIGGKQVKCYAITFYKDKMTVLVPMDRVAKAGLRHISCLEVIEKALHILQSRPVIKKGMWSKRAQEFEEKICSGNLFYLAEVVRDLHKNVSDPNRSYSERVIYENALQRFIHEYAVARMISNEEADKVLKDILDGGKISLEAISRAA